MLPQAQRENQDERAARFERCVRPLLPGLFAGSMRLCRNRSEAEDLVQETVLRAWRFFDRFEAGSNLSAWLRRILLHTFVNRYRRARRERELMGQAHALREVAAAAGGDAQEPEILRAALSDGLE